MMKFEFDEQEAIGLIQLLGKLPTETGIYPIQQKMIAQFNEQKKEAEEVMPIGGTD